MLLPPLTLEYPQKSHLGGQYYPVSLGVIIWTQFVFVSQSISASILDYYTQSLFIDGRDMGWVLSQQLWRGKKESTCEGQPGWAPSACAPDLGTCPSCGTSAFCVSLLGSDSLAGVTWTLLAAFFPSSAKAMRRNAGFSHPG